MSSFLNNLNKSHKAIVSVGDFTLQRSCQPNYKIVTFFSDVAAIQDSVSTNIF